MYITVIILLVGYLNNCPIDNRLPVCDGIFELSQGDSLFINYYIAYGGEFGGRVEGIILSKQDEITATYVYYPDSIGIVSLNKNEILDYVQRNRSSYTIQKTWTPTIDQLSYLECMIAQLIVYSNHSTGEGFSNAPEWYTVYSNEVKLEYIDFMGNLKLHRNIRRWIGR